MRIRAISKSIGFLLLIFSPTFILPIITGVYFGEDGSNLALWYGLPALLSALMGFLLGFIGREEEAVRERESFIIVGIIWLLLPLFGAIPYILSGALPEFIDAFFESTSGFSTTGASVITDVENLSVVPHSILIWRATTAMLGGMGIIVLSMVVLSRIVGGSTQLFKAEASVHTGLRIRPTIKQIASTLWALYVGFIIVESLLLTAAGMSFFEAICHSFTTLSTCGFSTRNVGPAAFNDNPAIGIILTVFMIIGGTSFILHFDWLTGKFAKLREHPEFLLYIGIITVASIAIALILMSPVVGIGYYPTSEENVGHAVFNVVSLITTTGYASADFALWPSSAQLLLIILMLIGGCSGSTSGGLKIVRFVILAKVVRREIRKVLHPRAVHPLTMAGRPIPEDAIKNVISYFFIYLTSFGIIAIILCVVGMEMDEALASSASAFGGVGPALGRYGPMFTYASLHWVGKAAMILAMWMGRLEIYPALLLLSPSAYKR